MNKRVKKYHKDLRFREINEFWIYFCPKDICRFQEIWTFHRMKQSEFKVQDNWKQWVQNNHLPYNLLVLQRKAAEAEKWRTTFS